MTNRDLYLLVTGFESHPGGKRLRSLEEYLRALYLLAAPHRGTTPTVEQFAGWLESALTAPPLPFDPLWLTCERGVSLTEYDGWEACILFQIADLRRMAQGGQLSDPQRYFGIDSPSGSRWYNFDVLTYLECGVRGTFGGYEESEVTVLVPSPDGDDSPVFVVTDFGWNDFTSFLGDGQHYE